MCTITLRVLYDHQQFSYGWVGPVAKHPLGFGVVLSQLWVPTNFFDIAASRPFGVCMYCRNAALCHLPSVWIVESAIPTIAAVVAAPIRKLWPAN